MNPTNKATAPRRIAIVANTSHKTHLIEWAFLNKEILRKQQLFANGKTAQVLEGTLNVPVTELASRTLGGYRDLIKLINKEQVDMLFVLNYDQISEKRQKQVSELLQSAMEQNIIVAPNLATAEIVMSTLEEAGSSTEGRDDNGNHLSAVV